MKKDGVIDIALADTIAGRHWLHPVERFGRHLAAIRAKHRRRHLERLKRERDKKQ